jgi:hypothetical protein
MSVSEIKLYELLRNSIGEKDAKSFVYLINENMEKKFEQWKSELATKDDLIATKEEIAALRIATKEDISALRTELLRTIYLTSMGQLIAIVASVVLLLKK